MSAAPAGAPARPSLRRRIRLLFALVVVLAVVVVSFGTVVFLGLLDARRVLVDRIGSARLESQVLLSALVDQETGVRGYVLARDPAFLEPYDRGTATESEATARIERLVDDLPPVIDDLQAAQRAADAWQADYALPAIAAVTAGEPVDPDTTELGRQRFGRVRAAHDRLDAQVEAARVVARESLDRRTAALIATMGAGLVVTVGGVIALWVAYRRSVEIPLAAVGADARRVASGDLGHHVAPTGPEELAQLATDVDLMRARIVEELQAARAARSALEAQATELARSNTELEQFAYVASHDLQEPLRKVASFCQLLQTRYGGQLDERADQYIEFAVDGAKRMQSLINDLLTFSRVGRASGPLEPVDCDQALHRALENLSTAVEESGAEVVVDDLPVVDGDLSLLTALFQNLVGNAIKFRQPGVTPRVTITAALADEPPGDGDGDERMWGFTVADNGIGIESEYADRVFVIFQRLHAKEAYAGTGIGLSLCRKIVEHHGGRIWIDPSGGEGATVRFTLPVRALTTPEGAAA